MRDRTYKLKSKKLWLLTLAGGIWLAWSAPSLALGFGEPVSRATLGEPLSVTVPVRLNAGEELDNECVVADVFYGDDKLGSSAVNVDMSGSGNQRLARVRTTSRIQEPVFTVYLVVGCKTKITRKFVGFADPPGMDIQPAQVIAADLPRTESVPQSGRPSASATTVVPSARAEAVASPGLVASALPPSDTRAVSAGRPPRPAAANASPTVRQKPVRQDRIIGSQAAVNGARGTQVRPVPQSMSDSAKRWSARVDERTPEAQTGARLMVEPAAVDAMVEPRLALSSGMAMPEGGLESPQALERRAAAAALWAAMNTTPEQLARDRQRMQELEARLSRLQLDAAAASRKLQDMEVRVREAEDKRFNHPLVYALAGGCLLLAGALGWMFFRQRGQSQSTTEWWPAGTSPDDNDPVEPVLDASDPEDSGEHHTQPGALMAPQAASVQQTGAWALPLSPEPVAQATMPIAPMHGNALAEAQHRADDLMATQPVSLKQREPVREMSVEELIDLEQQAEFFVVLGQDHAATELLESHVQSSAGGSPLPYLKLLEIYKRLGQHADYDRVQHAFNERFNAYAPSWESDLQQGHLLEEYPGVVERLQALWSQPRKAMEVLQQSLTRPDDTVETFDLPAYRELLTLYSVARDLSDRQQEDHVEVDINVPDLSLDEPDAGDTVVAPLTATRPVKAEPKASPTLSVDFSLDDVPLPAVAEPAVKASPPRDDLGPIEFVVVPDEPKSPGPM